MLACMYEGPLRFVIAVAQLKSPVEYIVHISDDHSFQNVFSIKVTVRPIVKICFLKILIDLFARHL
jgi:hypothetical protein